LFLDILTYNTHKASLCVPPDLSVAKTDRCENGHYENSNIAKYRNIAKTIGRCEKGGTGSALLSDACTLFSPISTFSIYCDCPRFFPSSVFPGEAKTQHGLRRAARCGIANVAIQVYMTAAVMNLKRLAAFFYCFLRHITPCARLYITFSTTIIFHVNRRLKTA
jgi:hypothetical protein